MFPTTSVVFLLEHQFCRKYVSYKISGVPFRAPVLQKVSFLQIQWCSHESTNFEESMFPTKSMALILEHNFLRKDVSYNISGAPFIAPVLQKVCFLQNQWCSHESTILQKVCFLKNLWHSYQSTNFIESMFPTKSVALQLDHQFCKSMLPTKSVVLPLKLQFCRKYVSYKIRCTPIRAPIFQKVCFLQNQWCSYKSTNFVESMFPTKSLAILLEHQFCRKDVSYKISGAPI